MMIFGMYRKWKVEVEQVERTSVREAENERVGRGV